MLHLEATRVLPRVTVLALATLLAACGGGSSGQTAGQGPAPSGNATLSADEMQRSNPADSPERALMGRFPGVNVQQNSDGSLKIQIRGGSQGPSQVPLYLLDGMQIQPEADGSLRGINPGDIASIKVLKDPADLTMYGSRGANGVVVITTKRARKP